MSIMQKYRSSYLSYFLMYFFFFFSVALFSGFISIYLMDKGYRASQVSLVVSCSFVLSMLVQPAIGRLNDKYDSKRINTILLSVTVLFSILFTFLNTLYLIAIVYSLVISTINSTVPVIERMAILSKYRYGSIRVWGTIGYAVATIISGFLYQYLAPESLYWFFAVSECLCIIGILGTENIISEGDKEESNHVITQKTPSKSVIIEKNMIIYLVIVCIFYGVTNVHHIFSIYA